MPLRLVPVSLLLLLAAVGCGGPEFTGGAGGGAGSAGGGAGGQGGSGGSNAGRGGMGGTTAGTGGTAGSGGSGGSITCSCPAGQYCRAGKCLDCADLSTLDFGEPEVLEGLDANLEGEPRFPRVGDGARALFYSSQHLWYTSDFEDGSGTPLTDLSVLPETAPLYLANPGNAAFNLLFSRGEIGSRQIVLANWDGVAYATESGAPAPINDELADDFNAAFASESHRYWWMSNRDQSYALYTAGSNDSSAQELELEIGSTGCQAPSDDFTPWVTPDGALMLFRAQPVDATCDPVDGSATDLYAARLGANDGEPLLVLPLDEVNLRGGSSESDPSFSADLCHLYFASNRDGGEYRIYRAARE